MTAASPRCVRMPAPSFNPSMIFALKAYEAPGSRGDHGLVDDTSEIFPFGTAFFTSVCDHL